MFKTKREDAMIERPPRKSLREQSIPNVISKCDYLAIAFTVFETPFLTALMI